MSFLFQNYRVTYLVLYSETFLFSKSGPTGLKLLPLADLHLRMVTYMALAGNQNRGPKDRPYSQLK